MKTQRICFLLALVFSLTVFSYAQTTSPQPTPPVQTDDDENTVLKIESRLVIVPVSVLDASGQPVLGLTDKDFAVLEENRSQEVAQVSDAEKVPLEIALLSDVSGSINPLFEFEKQAAAQFLESVMRPDDRATIFLIGDAPVVNLERQSAQQAASSIRTVTLSGKFTAFYDTVTLAAKYLQKNAPVRSRRVILALTDGEDNWSNLTREKESQVLKDVDINKLTTEKLNQRASISDKVHQNAQNQVLRDLQNADTVFYSINPAGNSFRLNKISLRAQNGLQRFAEDTGGTAYLPNFLPVNLKDTLQNSANSRKNAEILAGIFRQLTNELQAQYLVQYYSEAEFPVNRYVKLKVNLQNPRNFKLRARQGYFVKR